MRIITEYTPEDREILKQCPHLFNGTEYDRVAFVILDYTEDLPEEWLFRLMKERILLVGSTTQSTRWMSIHLCKGSLDGQYSYYYIRAYDETRSSQAIPCLCYLGKLNQAIHDIITSGAASYEYRR